MWDWSSQLLLSHDVYEKFMFLKSAFCSIVNSATNLM